MGVALQCLKPSVLPPASVKVLVRAPASPMYAVHKNVSRANHRVERPSVEINKWDPLPRPDNAVDALDPVDRRNRMHRVPKRAELIVREARNLALHHLLLRRGNAFG